MVVLSFLHVLLVAPRDWLRGRSSRDVLDVLDAVRHVPPSNSNAVANGVRAG